jgi:uncharacterized protein YdiU (UPF0061 family)
MVHCVGRIVLRNYVAQNAIEAAEHGDFSEVQRVLSLIQHPFDDQAPGVDSNYEARDNPTSSPGISHYAYTDRYS